MVRVLGLILNTFFMVRIRIRVIFGFDDTLNICTGAINKLQINCNVFLSTMFLVGEFSTLQFEV